MRGKSAVVCGGAVALSGLLLSAYAGLVVDRLLLQGVSDRGRLTARQLAYNSIYGVVTENRSLLDQLAQAALDAGDSDLIAVTIRDAKGQPLAQHGRATGISPVVVREAVPVTAEGTPSAHPSRGSVVVVMDAGPAQSAAMRATASMLAGTAVLAVVLGLAGGAVQGRDFSERAG